MNRGPSRNNKYKYGAEVLASGEDLATSVPRQRVRKGTKDGDIRAWTFGAVTISSRFTNHVPVSVTRGQPFMPLPFLRGAVWPSSNF